MTTATAPLRRGLSFSEVFTDGSPVEQIEWEGRDIRVKDWETKETIFAQDRFRVPKFWSENAGQIVASKYAFGPDGDRESGVDVVVNRVVNAIVDFGLTHGYFASVHDAKVFRRELKYLCLHQYGAFNSPVWFNVGIWQSRGLLGTGTAYHWDASFGRVVKTTESYRYPQTSACFIQPVTDDMESLMALATSEAMLFKHGSGSGTDFSKIRSKREFLSTGGRPSGPVSFMKVYDRIAATIKSGGKTRRAAKMQTMHCSHPDILDFIRAKGNEEKKAHALIRQGYSNSWNGEAYDTVAFQNANFSVRCPDKFMNLIAMERSTIPRWPLNAVTTGEMIDSIDPRELWSAIAEETHRCGDPAVQFCDTINAWHTCPNSGPINSSNPCCFPYHTLVETSEGRIPIGKLAEMAACGDKLPLAYGFDLESGQPVLRQIMNAFCSGETRRLVEVRTQRGLTFRCTPEHRFLLRSGKYVEAKDLKPGNRLRKIARAINEKRSSRRYINRKADTIWENRFVWEQANGPIPDGMEVHHKDEDATNDRLSNLELIAIQDHDKIHSSGEANARYIECPANVLVETWEAIEAAPRKTYTSVGQSVTYSRWNKYVRDHKLSGVVPLARSGGRIRGMEWAEFSEWIEGKKSEVNDRIESVEPVYGVTEGRYVYDLEVEGTHNFAIATENSVHSVVVHNSEYLFLDDSACNLASLRLTKFYRDGKFQIEEFRQAVRIFIVAQEILVDMGSYPTAKIAQNQHDYRTLGLGFADLGGLLMRMGLAYDSDEGRALAGCIAALLTGEGYCVSSEMACEFGAFNGFERNREPMLQVVSNHAYEASKLRLSIYGSPYHILHGLTAEAEQTWERAFAAGMIHGYRNAQISVVAPTGTISFMMDCDTTGIEPSIGLVQYKTLAGGGHMTIVNDAVEEALDALGYGTHYGPGLKATILQQIRDNGHVSDSVYLKPEHLAVFDCALAPKGCDRTINYRGHLGMMAAVQPFISGAISKTVNVPEHFTPEEIADVYLKAWKLGLKCVAIYRDKSKGSQPVTLDRPSELADMGELVRDHETEEELLDEIEYQEYIDLRDTYQSVCSNCSAPTLVIAGTCSVCSACGEPQGGCS